MERERLAKPVFIVRCNVARPVINARLACALERAEGATLEGWLLSYCCKLDYRV